MSEPMIPERWMPNYLDMKALPKELAAGGAAIMVLIEELGTAEAKVAEQKATILDVSQRWLNDACTKQEIIDRQAATIERIERLTKELSEFEGKLAAAHVTLGQLAEAFHDESAEQAATIAELEEFKKSVLDNCTGCGYSLFLPQEPK